MKKKYPFPVAVGLANEIDKVIPGMDLQTDYAFRRTVKSMRRETKTVIDGLGERVHAMREFEKCWADNDREQAEKEHPEGAKAHKELMSAQVEFEVFTLPAKVLEKPFPHRPGCVRPADFDIGTDKTGLSAEEAERAEAERAEADDRLHADACAEGLFKELLSELGIVRDENS